MSSSSKRCRIALLFEYATLNGGERSMLACIDWLLHHEPQLEFVAIAPATGRLADALSARNIPVKTWNESDSTGTAPENRELALLEALQQYQPQLLHANSLSMGRLTGRLAPRLSIPTSAHLRDILKLSRAAIADLNQNHRLIAVSQATQDAHVGQGMDGSRITVVHNGVDLDLFQPRPATGLLHRELSLPTDSLLLATIGQIGLRKGQDVLAAAAAEIVRNIPQAHFLLLGERSSTKTESIEFEKSIEAKFAERELAGRLHRLGYRDDMPDLMSEFDIVVHPANQEPFGRVLLEAAASGVPVVATHVGGTAEIVIDGVTGLLVPPRDPPALAAAVSRLLADSSARQAMRTAARNHAVHRFDVATAAQKLSRAWAELL